MAMEKLGQLRSTDEWDLIVVDTPPSRSALDFLDAPARLSRFLDGRRRRMLLTPAPGGGPPPAAAAPVPVGAGCPGRAGPAVPLPGRADAAHAARPGAGRRAQRVPAGLGLVR